MKVADYKELRVYRLAYDSAMEIFRLSRSWPSEERFSLIDQIRFVLPKLHAKWLQFSVARNGFLDFLWAYFSAARPHIYKHLRKQEHWQCGTRRPRVSRNCDSGRWRSFVSFWFWLCQFRRSSRSVCTNIAEAWRKRRYQAAFVSKLSDSDTEAAEIEVHLSFARDCGYLPADVQHKLQDHYDHICRQLTNMINDAGSWCGTGGEFREVPPEYVVEREERSSVEREERRALVRRDTPSPPRSAAPNASHASRS
jgi:four helix bundle protein